MLDLGAADGLTLLAMRALLNGPGSADTGGRGTYHGIELSPELRNAAPTLPDGVELIEGDVQDLPAQITEGDYDLCTALAVLEHLPQPEACAAEALRCLRPGGVFVATCPAPFWDHISGNLGLVRDEHHEQEMNIDDMVRLVADAGFERIEPMRFMWAPIGVLPYFGVAVPPRAGLRIDRWVRWLNVLDFGFVNQAIVAQKPMGG